MWNERSSPAAKRSRLSLTPGDTEETALSSPAGSDIVEYFHQRGSRLRDLEEQHLALVRQNEYLKEEVRSLRAELQSQSESARLQALSQQTAIDLCEREQAAAEEAYAREMGRTSAAAAKLVQAETQQYECLDRAEKAEVELADLKGRLQYQINTSEAAAAKLRGELQDALENARLEREQRIHAQQQQTSNGKPLEELQRQLEELHLRAEEESRKRRALEISQAEQAQRAELAEAQLREASKGSDGSNADIIKALRSELRAQEAEIAQAKKIQSHVKSLRVLQEKLKIAEARAAMAEKEQVDTSGLLSKISSLENQAREWETSANDLGLDDPREVFEKLGQLRAENLAAGEKLGEKESELRTASEALRATERQRDELEATLHSVQGSNAELAASSARSERRLALVTREKDGLQKILASYNFEGGESLPAVQAAEKEALEAQLKELKQQHEHLEEALSQSATAAKLLEEQLADALARAAATEQDKHQLEQSVERQATEIHDLQGRVDRGEYNTTSTRVLHYVLNPEAESRREQQESRIEELESEVAVLRLQQQRASRAAPSEGSPQLPTADALLEAQVVVLQQKVTELAKKEARLKEVFQKQAANYREAVFLLFGYRVDMAAEAASTGSARLQPTTFVLRPQHAENIRMQLMFRLKGGVMELIPTEYTTKRLKREVETFIENFHSIPAFTANWTMELFQRQTSH